MFQFTNITLGLKVKVTILKHIYRSELLFSILTKDVYICCNDCLLQVKAKVPDQDYIGLDKKKLSAKV